MQELVKKSIKNYVYGPHPRNVFDLWLADSDKPTPIIVWIHGGGFMFGSKEESTLVCLMKRALAEGISFASINYRLSQQEPFPAPFIDGGRALQNIRLHSKRWNIDPSRVIASGSSARLLRQLSCSIHQINHYQTI